MDRLYTNAICSILLWGTWRHKYFGTHRDLETNPLWVSRMTILNTSLKYCFPVIVVTKRGWFYITYTNEIQACNILYTIKPLWNVIRSNIFKFFFLCVCVCTGAHMWVQVPLEARIWHYISWRWSYKWVWATQLGFWDEHQTSALSKTSMFS